MEFVTSWPWLGGESSDGTFEIWPICEMRLLDTPAHMTLAGLVCLAVPPDRTPVHETFLALHSDTLLIHIFGGIVREPYVMLDYFSAFRNVRII